MDVKKFLFEGNKTPNPEYNPKTKKGAAQPPSIVNYNPGTDETTKIRSSIANQILLNTNFLNSEEYDKYSKYDTYLSSNAIEEDLNYERAINQSKIEQFGNFLIQAGIGELFYGSLEGFGNIYDGVLNLFKGGDYERSAWTKYFEDKKNEVISNHEIYLEDPNRANVFNDFGWWMKNAVTVASTASLALPAAGWTKGLSVLGKATRLNRIGNAGIKAVSRGLAKGAKTLSYTGKFSSLRSMAGKAGRIETSIRTGGALALQSTISRTGENFMEAKAVHDDVKMNVIENLQGMLEYDRKNGTKEFEKFIQNNKEFLNEEGVPLPIEEIASIIATKAANKTFYNDYAMLISDYLQLRALGGLWGKQRTKTPSARQRIIAENTKRQLAGKTGEDLIKDNIINRTKFNLKDVLKDPFTSISALQLEEGFEEIYQGIQSEKGYEVATKYFDKNFTPRTVFSYLSDGHIWEQGLWGILGGIGYNGVVRGLQSGGKHIEGLWNKSHMSAEEYERWKKSSDKIATEHLAGITAKAKMFTDNMETLNNNLNPFEYVIDPVTRKRIYKDGKLKNEEIDDIQKELLKEQAVDEFITQTTLDSVDAGTIDLLKEVLTSSEFDKFISSKNISSSDKALVQQIVQRMNDIEAIYTSELTNINSMADSSNPYTERLAARSITKSRLTIEEFDRKINNIQKRIDELNTSNAIYTPTERNIEAEYVNEMVNALKKRYEDIKSDKEISESAKKQMRLEIIEQLNALSEMIGLTPNTEAENINIDTVFDTFENKYNILLNQYNNALSDVYELPPYSIEKLIKEKAEAKVERAYEAAKLPSSDKQYQRLYEEFGRATDQVIVTRLKLYIDAVKKYLRNSEDLEEAIRRIYAENTGNKKLDEGIAFLRYGYNSLYDKDSPSNSADLITNLQLSTIIEGVRKERNKDKEKIDKAKEEGTPLPEETSTTEEKDKDKSVLGEFPLTGDETKTSSENDIPLPVMETSDKDASKPVIPRTDVSPEMTIDVDDDTTIDPFEPIGSDEDTETPVDVSVIAATNTDTEKELTEKEKEEYSKIAAQSETPRAKAEFIASEYIAKLASTNKALFEKINKEIANGNKDTYNKLINDIVEALVKKGYNVKIATSATKEAFIRVVDMFSDLDSKSVFYRLATQLAAGFKLQGKELNAATGEITNEELDSIVEEFITEYNKKIDNIQTENGKYLINVYNIIQTLLKENIPTNVASRIYNNLFKFIDRHDGSKYIFTGYNEAVKVTAHEFVENLLQNSRQSIAQANDLHIHPIEKGVRHDFYEEALIAAYQGAPVEVVQQGNNDKGVTNLNIVVHYKRKREIIKVVVGTLRTVSTNSTLSEFTPVSHWSGFKNEVRINSDGTITLDSDDFFNELIDGKNNNSEWLLNKIINYRIKVRQALSQESDKAIKKALADALTEDEAKEILNNKLVKKLIQRGVYKFYNEGTTDDLNKAKQLIDTIANIIFYDSFNESNDNVNNTIDKMSTGRSNMRINYSTWKEAVKTNYTHTYELQKSFTEGKRRFIKLNVGYYTHLNIIRDRDKFNNVSNLPFNPIPNSPNLGNYTPFIMVNNKRQLIGEDGKVYGYAPLTMEEYSMGYVVGYDNDIPKIAYLTERIKLSKDNKLREAIEAEIRDIFTKQFANGKTNETHNHNDEFENIVQKCIELFGYGELFLFEGTRVFTNNDRSIINIRFEDGKSGFTIFRNNAIDKTGTITEGTSIRIIGRNGAQHDFHSLNDTNAKLWFDSLTNELMKRVRVNRSSIGFNKKDRNGVTPNMIDTSDGKFTVKLGGKTLVYENYGDFIHKSGAFIMDVGLRKGSFITKTLNDERLTIDMTIKDENSIPSSNTDVSDLMFVDRKDKNKTVKTEDVLKAANVPQEKIDILMGTSTGIQLLSKRIYPNSDENAKGNASYKKSEDKIYVTIKGAMNMNNRPSNAIRLLLHENIHRAFYKKSEYSQEEKDRIVKELREVYNYLIDKLNTDLANKTIDEDFYSSVMTVLTKVDSYNTEATRMEEFLVECLSQEHLTNYLNNTEYKEQALVTGIKQKNKTLLQKIIDILLKLFGINKENIKNNSILAREYLILSRGIESTSSNIGIIPAVPNSDNNLDLTTFENTESPVEVTQSFDNIDVDINYPDIDFSDFDDIELLADTDFINPTLLKAINTEEQQILNTAPRDSQGRLLAPNGKPSNLTEKQYAQVRTKNFINWFGDWINDSENASKVIDENGEPLVVYHNTNEVFNEFDKNLIGKNYKGGMFGRGFYFTNNNEYSKIFGKNKMSVFLNIKHPLTKETNTYDFKDYIMASHFNKTKNIDLTIFNGEYDGVVGYNDSEKSVEYVVNESNQVKSATDNIGTFSTTENNIYLADTEQITPAEIFTTPIANGYTESVYGVQVVNDINEFVNSFPLQYRNQIKLLLDENEINYACQ